MHFINLNVLYVAAAGPGRSWRSAANRVMDAVSEVNEISMASRLAGSLMFFLRKKFTLSYSKFFRQNVKNFWIPPIISFSQCSSAYSATEAQSPRYKQTP